MYVHYLYITEDGTPVNYLLGQITHMHVSLTTTGINESKTYTLHYEQMRDPFSNVYLDRMRLK